MKVIRQEDIQTEWEIHCNWCNAELLVDIQDLQCRELSISPYVQVVHFNCPVCEEETWVDDNIKHQYYRQKKRASD